MRFKDFLKEDGNSQETGLFVNLNSGETTHSNPSQGHRGVNQTKITAGARASAGGMGVAGSPAMGGSQMGTPMMKKFMKQFMKKMSKA